MLDFRLSIDLRSELFRNLCEKVKLMSQRFFYQNQCLNFVCLIKGCQELMFCECYCNIQNELFILV